MRTILLVLFMAQVGVLHAQSVVGRIIGANDRPVAHALVVLSDTAGNFSTRVVTTATGRFLIAAPRSGSYTLRLAAIGHAPLTLPPFDIPEGRLSLGDLAIKPVVVSLADIEVFAMQTSCGPRGGGAEVLGQLLDAARTSLEVMETAIFGLGSDYRVETELRRTIGEGRSERVTVDSSASRLVGWPIRSVSPDSLRRAGFSVQLPWSIGEGREWYGPDVGVLFADWFLDSHCFLIDAGASDSLTIVLKFDPSSRQDELVDIAGSLLINRQTLALEELEFSHRFMPYGLRPGMAGGSIAFAPLPSGLWMPIRWQLFAPIQLPDGRSAGQLMQSGAVVGEFKDPGGRRGLDLRRTGKSS
jgi:hypothetical protein